MVASEWIDDTTQFISQGDEVKSFYLNYYRGWSGSDYSFLMDLKAFEELHILSGSKAVNLAAIEGISGFFI